MIKDIKDSVPRITLFLSRIKISESGCWEWQGTKNEKGYGRIRIDGVLNYSHRFIYEYYHGSICPDLTIDHLCRIRACVNPLHLEQVSNKVNVLRGIGIAAINSRKTECLNGHEFTQDNTSHTKLGQRSCKTCSSIRGKNRRIRDKLGIVT